VPAFHITAKLRHSFFHGFSHPYPDLKGERASAHYAGAPIADTHRRACDWAKLPATSAL
jgi:hypothetical protein